MTDSFLKFLKTEPSGTNLETSSRSSPRRGYPPSIQYSAWSLPHDDLYQVEFRWGLYRGVDPFAVGQAKVSDIVSMFAPLLKLQRQYRERLAAVWLDTTAQELLSALDQETSIKWEDLPDNTGGDWSVASRSAALLVGANLCEVSSTRIRLSEYGDKLLAESSSVDQTATEVAS